MPPKHIINDKLLLIYYGFFVGNQKIYSIINHSYKYSEEEYLAFVAYKEYKSFYHINDDFNRFVIRDKIETMVV